MPTAPNTATQRNVPRTAADPTHPAARATAPACTPPDYPWLAAGLSEVDPLADDDTFEFARRDDLRVSAKHPALEVCPTLTAATVAAMFGVTTRTLRNWVKRGLLTPIRIGRTLRFCRQDIERLLRIGIDKNSVQNE